MLTLNKYVDLEALPTAVKTAMKHLRAHTFASRDAIPKFLMNIRGGANDSDLPTPEELTKEIQSMTPEQITAAKAASHETMQDDVLWAKLTAAMKEVHEKKNLVLSSSVEVTNFCRNADPFQVVDPSSSPPSPFQLSNTWDPLCTRVNKLIADTYKLAIDCAGDLKRLARNLDSLPTDEAERQKVIDNIAKDMDADSQRADDAASTAKALSKDLSNFRDLLKRWTDQAQSKKLVDIKAAVAAAQTKVENLCSDIAHLEAVLKGLEIAFTIALAAASIEASIVSCIPFVGAAIAAGIIAACVVSFTIAIGVEAKKKADKESELQTAQDELDNLRAQQAGLEKLIEAAPRVLDDMGNLLDICTAIFQIFRASCLWLQELKSSTTGLTQADIDAWKTGLNKLSEELEDYAGNWD